MYVSTRIFPCLGDRKLRTLPFPIRRPTFAELKRVHSKLATLYHPVLVSSTNKPRTVEDSPLSHEAFTSVSDSMANTSTVPSESIGEPVLQAASQESIDYPDTRIKLQINSPPKHLFDKNG